MASLYFDWIIDPKSNKIISIDDSVLSLYLKTNLSLDPSLLTGLPREDTLSRYPLSKLNNHCLKVLNGCCRSDKSKYYSLNCYRYNYSVDINLANHELEMIRLIINIIGYNPLKYRIKINDDINFNNDAEIISKYSYIKPIVSRLTSYLFNVSPESIQMQIEYGNKISEIIYNPIIGSDPIFFDKDLIQKNSKSMELIDYLGYTLLSTDNLTPYALYTNGTNLIKSMTMTYSAGDTTISPEIFTSKNIRGEKFSNNFIIYLINISFKNYQYFIITFNDYIKKLRSDGYISILGGTSLSGLLPEIAYCWSGITYRSSNIIVIKNNFDFNLDPEQWYQIASKRILSGHIPQVNFFLPNFIEYSYNDVGIEDLHQYLVDRYKLVLNRYEDLREYIISLNDGNLGVTLNKDLSVTANFLEAEEANYYYDLIKDVQYDNIPQMTSEIVSERNLDYSGVTELLDIRLEKLGTDYVISLNCKENDFITSNNDGSYLYLSNGNYNLELRMKEITTVLNDTSSFKILFDGGIDDEYQLIEMTKKFIEDYKSGYSLDIWSKHIFRKYGKLSRMLLTT